MALAATFLGSARSRLLPASVPFRFFGAAVGFHVLGWIALGVGAADALAYRGGLGWPLAALHAVTLGVLVMTAMGASLQLLPVATRQAIASSRAPKLLWWLYTPGVAVLLAGMALAQPVWLAAGALAVATALAGYAMLLARNLLGARGMPVVVGHGWAALAGLAVLLASAASLVAAYLGLPLLPRQVALALHVPFAAYGFMGLLALGFSYILVPMFALSDSAPLRPALASLALALAALGLAALAGAGVAPALAGPAAAITGALALALHVALMLRALRSGMRRRLGRPFWLVRIGWAGLLASLAAALALQLDTPLARFDRLPALFAVLLVGSLLTFLLGMLTRIVPFLASMHAASGRRAAPLPSKLTAERPLALFFHCHLLALATLLAAVLAGSPWLARGAALLGTVGALAYAWFFVVAVRHMTAAPAAAGVASTAPN